MAFQIRSVDSPSKFWHVTHNKLAWAWRAAALCNNNKLTSLSFHMRWVFLGGGGLCVCCRWVHIRADYWIFKEFHLGLWWEFKVLVDKPMDKNDLRVNYFGGSYALMIQSFPFALSPPFILLSLSPPLFRSAGYQLARPPVAVGDGALTGECDWTARSLTSAYRKCWTLAGGGLWGHTPS